VKFRIKSNILLLDSTTISLCLSLFDWAKYKTRKGAVKMHTLLDYDGNLPAYVLVTDGKTADNKGAYDIPLLSNSVIVADRFYNDFSLLNVPAAAMSILSSATRRTFSMRRSGRMSCLTGATSTSSKMRLSG